MRWVGVVQRTIDQPCRGTSPTRKHPPLGSYRRPMPRALGGSLGGGRFLMGEVPLKWASWEPAGPALPAPHPHRPLKFPGASRSHPDEHLK